MIYNVAQLLKEPTGAARSYVLDETLPSPDPEWGRELPVEGELTLRRTPRGVLVTGSFNTTIPEECGRCLEQYQQPLTAELEEEYLPTTDMLTGVALETPENIGDLIIDQQHGLDISEAVRQSVLLARPIQPICKPDCLGLCPNCGTNLNQASCGCDRAPTDKRWNALRRLSA